MKYLMILILILSSLHAQEIKVEKIDKIYDGSNLPLSYIKLKDSATALVSTPNYIGLYKFDLLTKKIETISEKRGAGYNFIFNQTNIFYREDNYNNNRKFSDFLIHNFKTKISQKLLENIRDLRIIDLKNNEAIAYSNGEVKVYNSKLNSFTTEIFSNSYYSETNYLYKTGDPKPIYVSENGYIIWVDYCENNSLLLFTDTATGTLIIDEKGNIIKRIDNADSPVWSKTGEYIVYMNETDDGHKVISSDIYLYNFETEMSFNLTENSDIIAVYPDIDEDGKRVFFSDSEGNLFQLNFEEE